MNESVASPEQKSNDLSQSTSIRQVSIAWLECIFGAVIAVVFAGYLYEATQLPPPFNPRAVGPAVFPIIIGIATLLFAIVLTLLGLLKIYYRKRSRQVTFQRVYSVLFGMASLIGVGMVMEALGAFISVGLLSGLVLLAGGERRPVFLLFISVAVALFVYCVFVLALGVYFP